MGLIRSTLVVALFVAVSQSAKLEPDHFIELQQKEQINNQIKSKAQNMVRIQNKALNLEKQLGSVSKLVTDFVENGLSGSNADTKELSQLKNELLNDEEEI